MAESVYFYRYSAQPQEKVVDDPQKKLSFVPSVYQPAVINSFTDFGGIGDITCKSCKNESYAHLDRYGNSLVEVNSHVSNTLTSTEIDDLRHEVAKYRYVLDALTERLNALSASSTFSGDIVTKSPPSVAPVLSRQSVHPVRYANGKPSKGLDESVYVGFANKEMLAHKNNQNVYKSKLPQQTIEYHQAFETHQPPAVQPHQPPVVFENFDTVSTAGDLSVDTAVGGDLAAEPTVTKMRAKKAVNAENSVYHARELLNDYYA